MSVTPVSDSVKKYYPGTKFKLGDNENITGTVYPAGVVQMDEFALLMAKTLWLVANSNVKRDAETKALTEETLTKMLPNIAAIVLSDFRDLLIACTVFDDAEFKFGDLAHFDMAAAAQEFVIENFTKPGRLQKWKSLAEGLVLKLTGNQLQMSDIVSSFLSLKAGQRTTSSIADNQDYHTQGGPSSSGETPSVPPGSNTSATAEQQSPTPITGT
jgi:hypothetical protein